MLSSSEPLNLVYIETAELDGLVYFFLRNIDVSLFNVEIEHQQVCTLLFLFHLIPNIPCSSTFPPFCLFLPPPPPHHFLCLPLIVSIHVFSSLSLFSLPQRDQLEGETGPDCDRRPGRRYRKTGRFQR